MKQNKNEWEAIKTRIYVHFGGMNKEGILLGTIDGVREGKGGLNPIDDLSLKELRLIKKGLEKGDYQILLNKNMTKENIREFITYVFGE